MTRLAYTLTARSRVSVGMGPEVGNNKAIHPLVPGSTLRGALAAAWARDHGEVWGAPSLQFVDLFEGAARFGQATPSNATLRQMSMVTCKYPTSACPTGWQDLALAVLTQAPVPDVCPGCQGQWSTGRGWELEPDRAEGEAGVLVETTRTGLDQHGVAEAGKLFTRRALGVRTVFSGSLSLPGDLPDDQVAWFLESRTLRIGGQRSVLGAVRWSSAPTLEDELPGPRRSILRCLSPAVLIDEYGATSLDIGAELSRVLGTGVTVLARWLRPVRVAGWHAASGLPKPEDWALEAGSTIVLDGLPEDAIGRLQPGIGLRRTEGFGQVQLYWDRGEVMTDVAQRDSDHLVVAVNREHSPTRTDGSTARQDRRGERGDTPPQATDRPAYLAAVINVQEDVETASGPDITQALGAEDLVRGLRGLGNPRARIAALQSIDEGLGKVANMRRRGQPLALVEAAIIQLLALPWTRSLPQGALSALEAGLRDNDEHRARQFRNLIHEERHEL